MKTSPVKSVAKRIDRDEADATLQPGGSGSPSIPADVAARDGLSALDVKTAGRTLDLFEVFARHREPLSISGLARALGMPVSSTFNLIRSLEDRGHFYSVGPPRGRLYYPTRKLFRTSETIVGNQPWLLELEPRLRLARDRSGETVILGNWSEDRVLYLAVIEGTQTIRYTAFAGDLKPYHSSAIGKAMMSTRTSEERLATLERSPPYAITHSTIVDRAALIAEFDRSERRGYAETAGENVSDVMAIAIPLRLQGAYYAVALAGPLDRMMAERDAHLSCLRQIFADLAGPWQDQAGTSTSSLDPAGSSGDGAARASSFSDRQG